MMCVNTYNTESVDERFYIYAMHIFIYNYGTISIGIR